MINWTCQRGHANSVTTAQWEGDADLACDWCVDKLAKDRRLPQDKPKRYVAKPVYVTAVQTVVRMRVATPDGLKEANPGDMIVTMPDFSRRVVAKVQFDVLYQEAPE